MELTNRFEVAAPLDDAFALLTDVARVAPCLPGATLTGSEDGVYTGTVRVKVGPIVVTYAGKASFADIDASGHTAVLTARGRETKGQGNATATVTASLAPEGDRTVVSLVTDLTVTGRVAQFGRGVLADVSAKLVEQFVECLSSSLLAPSNGVAPSEPGAPVGPAEPVEALDLLALSKGPIMTRLAPALVAAGIAGLAAWALLRHCGRASGGRASGGRGGGWRRLAGGRGWGRRWGRGRGS